MKSPQADSQEFESVCLEMRGFSPYNPPYTCKCIHTYTYMCIDIYICVEASKSSQKIEVVYCGAKMFEIQYFTVLFVDLRSLTYVRQEREWGVFSSSPSMTSRIVYEQRGFCEVTLGFLQKGRTGMLPCVCACVCMYLFLF